MLLWLQNLGFAGGGTVVSTPAVSPPGGSSDPPLKQRYSDEEIRRLRRRYAKARGLPDPYPERPKEADIPPSIPELPEVLTEEEREAVDYSVMRGEVIDLGLEIQRIELLLEQDRIQAEQARIEMFRREDEDLLALLLI